MKVVNDARSAPLLKNTSHDPTKSGFPRRSLPDARQAYRSNDIEASRAAHTVTSPLATLIEQRGDSAHVEGHLNSSSEVLKAIVFGGLDGIVTIFAMVAGCVGAKLTLGQVAIVGIGNLLADAISMGFGEYVGAKAEVDYRHTEKSREEWELRNYPDGEKQEMFEIYVGKYGFTEADARQMVELAYRYKDFFLSHMMAEELGIIMDDEGPSPQKRGAVMWSAFLGFGSVPLLGYVAWSWLTSALTSGTSETVRRTNAFIVAALLSCATLFILGALKASFVQQKPIWSGFQMVANGVISGGIAYSVGILFQNFVGSSDIA